MRPIITTNSDDHIGLTIVRSLGKNNVDFQVVSTTKNTLAGYSRYCNHKIIGHFDLEFFSKLSKDDVVFPMLEDTMLLLSKHSSKLHCQMGFSDFETLQITTDKSLAIQHAIEHKIPCPETFFITKSEDIKKCISCIDLPIILKPNKGSGGKGIRSVDSPILLPAIAEKFLKENGPFLLQEKIPYTTKYTIGTLCNSEHELKRICIIKELRNHPFENGPACYVETVNAPGLVNMAEKLLKSLNFVGIADIDLVIDSRDNQPKLMEINPRFWGSTQVAINAGVDFPALLYTMLKDGDIKKSLSYKTGVRCRYLLYTDLVRLISILRSDCSSGFKRKTFRDFFIIHKSDGYYVYSHDDIMPFFGLAYIKLLRKFGLEKKSN
jgi:predicted ATP-grasp superfamily ATP-dependent carboligase